jgi:hypothetical protein
MYYPVPLVNLRNMGCQMAIADLFQYFLKLACREQTHLLFDLRCRENLRSHFDDII